MISILSYSQDYHKFGHGGENDPIGFVNLVRSPDIFMTVNISGKCHGRYAWKVPNHCVHVIQWLDNMKVRWTTVGLDGEMVEGLSPVYDFLAEHVLCHRDQKSFSAPPKKFISGLDADTLSAKGFSQANRVQHPLAVKFDNFSQSERLKHMGVGAHKCPDSPPSKMAKTVTVSQLKTKPSVLQLKTLAPVTSPVVVSDANSPVTNVVNNITVTKSFVTNIDVTAKESTDDSIIADNKVSKNRTVSHHDFHASGGKVVPKPMEINLDNRCPCMDSLGYLPFGCNCDQLDVETPSDSDIFGRDTTNDHIVPKVTFAGTDNRISSKSAKSVVLHLLDPNKVVENQRPLLVPNDDIVAEPNQDQWPQISFPRILPESPPGRRVPPLFRWEVHIRHRSTDPALPSAAERRMIFMESVQQVPFVKDSHGPEYKERQDYDWRRLLG